MVGDHPAAAPVAVAIPGTGPVLGPVDPAPALEGSHGVHGMTVRSRMPPQLLLLLLLPSRWLISLSKSLVSLPLIK